MARWQAKQLRSGLQRSLLFTVPATAAEMRVTMDADAFEFSGQTIDFTILVTLTDDVNSKQTNGSTTIRGGDVDKFGNPFPSDAIPVLTVQIQAEPHPLKACIEHFVAGELTCGFDVTFVNAAGEEV